MARITRAVPHLSAEELLARWKQDPHPWRRLRWLIIYNALVDPREATDIAKHCGTTVATVHRVIAHYNRLGAAAVETPGKGGRHRQHMTLEDEQAFLAPFFSRAERGEIATAGEIKRAFESLEDLVDMLCQALHELTEDKERLRSMMFFPHFRVES
jgi:transposase